jgi:MFS family permease
VTAPAAPRVLQTLRELPGSARLLVGGVAINRMGSFVQVFLVLYLVDRGESAGRAGLALTVYGLGAVSGVFLGGTVSDRVGPRRTIIVSMVASGLLIGLLPFVTGYALLLPTCLGAGLAGQLYRPAAFSMLASLTPPDRLVLVAATYRLGLNIGSTAGPLLGAALLTWSPYALFLVDTATALLFALAAWRGLPATPVEPPEQRQAAASPLRDGRFVAVAAALALIALVEVQYVAALPLHVRDQGLPVGAYGLLVALNGLVVIAFELPLTRFVQGWPPRRAVPLGIALIGVGISLYGLPGGLPMLAAATLVWSLGEIVGAPSAAAYPAMVAPAAARGRYVALVTGGQSSGYAIGPVLGTLAYPVSPALTWAACAALGLLAAATARFGIRATAIPAPAGDQPDG